MFRGKSTSMQLQCTGVRADSSTLGIRIPNDMNYTVTCDGCARDLLLLLLLLLTATKSATQHTDDNIDGQRQQASLITLLSQSVVESSKVRSVSSPSDMSNAVEPPSEGSLPHPDHPTHILSVACISYVLGDGIVGIYWCHRLQTRAEVLTPTLLEPPPTKQQQQSKSTPTAGRLKGDRGIPRPHDVSCPDEPENQHDKEKERTNYIPPRQPSNAARQPGGTTNTMNQNTTYH